MILVFKEQLHIICFIYEDTIQEYFFQPTTNTNLNVDEYSKKRINFMLTKKKKEDMFFLCYTCQESSFHYIMDTKTGIQSEKKLNRIKPGRKL